MRKYFTRTFSSFSVQLFWCIFSTAIVLLIVGLLILNNYSAQNAVKMDNERMEESLRITANNIATRLNEVDNIAYTFFAQNDVLKLTKQPCNYPSNAYNDIRNAIIRTENTSPNISDMVYCDKWGNLFSAFIEPSLGNNGLFTDLDSCREFLSTMETYTTDVNETWYFLMPSLSGIYNHAFANVRNINLSANDVNPVLLIYYSENTLCSLYRFLGEESFIMTDSGTIVSAVDKAKLGEIVDEKVLNQITEIQKPISFVSHGKRYHASFCPVINCYLVVPSDSTVLAQVNRSTAIVTMVILLAGIFLSIIWSRLIAHSMTRPLVSLKQIMEQVQNGDLTVRGYTERSDEIGFLYSSFNYMMDMVNQYLEQHKQQYRLAQIAELQLMQAQINPHLLYNSLDSALYLMSSDHSELSCQVLEELSHYFRLSLQKGSRIVKVGSAIELVKTYLRLQNLCRMKEYQVEVKGDLSVLDVDILHMCMQPVVENSVLHGLEGSYTDGVIEIFLSRDKNDVLIRIQDNGMGMDDLQLENLQNRINSTNLVDGGYGLWNVAQRIRIHYGDSYGLTVESELGEYTAVTLRIPDASSHVTEDKNNV